jgi:hypothetical protein
MSTTLSGQILLGTTPDVHWKGMEGASVRDKKVGLIKTVDEMLK